MTEPSGSEFHAAIRVALASVDAANFDEPAAYWQMPIDALSPHLNPKTIDGVSIAVGFLVALRDRTDEAHTHEGRQACIDEAEVWPLSMLESTGGLTVAEEMEMNVAIQEANRLLGLGPDDGTLPRIDQ